jgi:hypothetical protein
VSSLRAAETRAFLVHAGRIAMRAGTAAGAQALLWMIAARSSLHLLYCYFTGTKVQILTCWGAGTRGSKLCGPRLLPCARTLQTLRQRMPPTTQASNEAASY